MEKENKKIDNIEKLVEVIATNVVKLTEDMTEVKKNMVTKKDLEIFKLETKTHFNNLESDLKSFKDDTNNSVEKIKKEVIDLTDTDMLYDKRLEKLESKFI
ncbi:MAG: hypothetical protein WC662_00740 [Candidatus Paceibacterota bacterium]|jgi:hypothetical protein